MLNTPDSIKSAHDSKTHWPEKHDLFGLQVSAVQYDEAVECIIHAARNGEPAIVSCHAVHAVISISRDRDLCGSANAFDMITPDGQPVRWALNSLYNAKLSERVYGPELMWRVLGECDSKGLSVYLYGGSEQTLGQLESNLRKAFPKLRIAGAKSPPFRALSDTEMERTAAEINESKADIVFIGLGCPKQDQFAADQSDRINAVQICVGAAFDFHAGSKPTAPAWMQRYGMEWLFRLVCEPRRLFKRYLTTNTLFVFCYLRAYLSKS